MTANLQKLNRDVAGWLGTWHRHTHWETTTDRVKRQVCMCGAHVYVDLFEKHCVKNNPDYITNPADLLREMLKREDWVQFANAIGCIIYDLVFTKDTVELVSCQWTIPTIYITDKTDGLLLIKVGEWMEGKR